MIDVYSPKELWQQLADPSLAEALAVVSGTNYVVVDARHETHWPMAHDEHFQPNCPVLGLCEARPALRRPAHHPAATWVDVFITEAEMAGLTAKIDASPEAATVLTQVLRAGETASIAHALHIESLAYSTLQHSNQFRAWRRYRSSVALAEEASNNAEPDAAPLVLIERDGNTLHLTLNRPAHHNAYNSAMRDELCQALTLALVDDNIDQLHWYGTGPSFCAGGDLREFGLAQDAGQAHITRQTRSAALLLTRLANRVHTHLHGNCIGAGIELPAFGKTISAHPDTQFRLPEVAFGLIPGAGGTVSMPRRIGRHRTAKIAITGDTVSVEEARSWGLINRIQD